MTEKLLPVSVVAQRLGRSVDTVYRFIAVGELVCIRTGVKKGYMISESELENFKKRRETN